MQLLEKALVKHGIQLGLERMNKAIDILNHPEKTLRVILVTGTNGKGSVVCTLSNILQCAGYNVGSYYSPHLIHYNERWQINGKEISDEKMHKYEQQMLRLTKSQQLTLFEAFTAIAYQYFSDENCDFAVMEVGMGGRLDATNIAQEEISIITTLGMEHTKHLGNSIEQIAYEKAGILKHGRGIIGEVPKPAKTTIENEAKKRNVSLKYLGKDFHYKLLEATDKYTCFDYQGQHSYNSLQSSLIGRYQVTNSSLAIAAAEELGISKNAIEKGLKQTKLNGRMEILCRSPLVVADGTHNVHSTTKLVNNLDLFKFDRLILLFAALQDKDWKGMLDLLTPKTSLLVTTQSSNSRSVKTEQLAEHAKKSTQTQTVPNIQDAYKKALAATKKNDLLLICGSLYFVGDILKLQSTL